MQFEAAVPAAPYLHPRLAASTVNANVKGVIVDLSPEQRRARIAALMQKLGYGSDGPVCRRSL